MEYLRSGSMRDRWPRVPCLLPLLPPPTVAILLCAAERCARRRNPGSVGSAIEGFLDGLAKVCHALGVALELGVGPVVVVVLECGIVQGSPPKESCCSTLVETLRLSTSSTGGSGSPVKALFMLIHERVLLILSYLILSLIVFRVERPQVTPATTC